MVNEEQAGEECWDFSTTARSRSIGGKWSTDPVLTYAEE